ncbi:MAG: RdgB/HAM1 family non-canonical purine NTP pyrophosphatase [Planctomycetota bacterium]|nr:MAG: RdgB/HAM1 family non-canonical purine NTP pyrophosphatase [Planctomycetota bacterium]
MKILTLGTRNPDKLKEIQEILLRVPVRLRPLPADLPEAPEEEPTLEGNALAKARFYAARTGTCCLADDTGLEVDALDGAPGVHSARFAGSEASYADNRDKLLEALAGVPGPRRTARFRTVVVVCTPGGDCLARAEGILEGEVLTAPRGDGGFGYDPIFRPLEERRSLAELSAEEKNRLSHRWRALNAIRPQLLGLL